MKSVSSGKNLIMEIEGESHSEYISGKVLNMPKGLTVDVDLMKEFLNRRKADGVFTTARTENDEPEILSGVTDGKTDGKAFIIRFKNENADDKPYARTRIVPRPSQSDYVSYVKYGEILPGGGHFSGRLTLVTTAIGFIFKTALEEKGIYVGSHILSVGKVKDKPFDPVKLTRKDFSTDRVPVTDFSKREKIKRLVSDAKSKGDSLGGVVECGVIGLPAGIGEPNFYGLENVISSYMFSIPGLKGIEFGNGFSASGLYGSENNDEFKYDLKGDVVTTTNNSGGINAGISNGMPVIFRLAFKPTPSICVTQKSIDLEKKENTKLLITGRHDPCYVLRVTPVAEAITAIAVYELYTEYTLKNDLPSLRKKIDGIDSAISELLNERIRAVKSIGEIKRKSGKAVTDTEREKEILSYVKSVSDDEKVAENVFKCIIENCKKVEL